MTLESPSDDVDNVNVLDIPRRWDQILEKTQKGSVTVYDDNGQKVGDLRALPADKSAIQNPEYIHHTDGPREFERTLKHSSDLVILRGMSTEDLAVFVPEGHKGIDAASNLERSVSASPFAAINIRPTPPEPVIKEPEPSPAEEEAKQEKASPPTLSLSRNVISIDDVHIKQGKEHLLGKMGENANAIKLIENGHARGYLIPDDFISHEIAVGSIVSAEDFRSSFEGLPDKGIRKRICFKKSELSGYSFVTPDIYEAVTTSLGIELDDEINADTSPETAEGLLNQLFLSEAAITATQVSTAISKNFIGTKIGGETGFNAISIEKRGDVRGYIVIDDIIAPWIRKGSFTTFSDFKEGFSYYGKSGIREGFLSHKKPTGYSFVTPDIFAEIRDDLEVSVKSSFDDAGGIKAVEQDEPVNARHQASNDSFKLQISPNKISISDIGNSNLHSDFLTGEIGQDGEYDAIVITDGDELVGCLMLDNLIPDEVTKGSLMNASIIQKEASAVLREYPRLRIALRNEPNGYSFVSVPVFNEIHSLLSGRFDVSDISIHEKVSILDEDAPSDVIGGFSFQEHDGSGKRAWQLSYDGEVFFLSEGQKDVAEALLESAEPLSRRMIENKGINASGYVLTKLEALGLIVKLSKVSDGRSVYFAPLGRPFSQAFSAREEISRGAKNIKPVRPQFEFMGLGGFEPETLPDDEPAFSAHEFLRPEFNPDPNITDKPYIPFNEISQIFQTAIQEFAVGNTSKFKRASKFEDGQMSPEQGRWVYVGEQENVASIEKQDVTVDYVTHPKAPDMLVAKRTLSAAEQREKPVEDGYKTHPQTPFMLMFG